MDNYIYRFLLEALQEQNRRQLTQESLKCRDAVLLSEYGTIQVKVHRVAGHTQALQGLSINPWVLDRYGPPLLLSPTAHQAHHLNTQALGYPRWTTWSQYSERLPEVPPRLILCDGYLGCFAFHCWTVATCQAVMQGGQRFSLVEAG